MTIARNIAQWAIKTRYEDLPKKTIHEVKRRVIDSLATTLGAYNSHPAKVVREKAMAVSDPAARASVWGTSHKTLPELAASVLRQRASSAAPGRRCAAGEALPGRGLHRTAHRAPIRSGSRNHSRPPR